MMVVVLAGRYLLHRMPNQLRARRLLSIAWVGIGAPGWVCQLAHLHYNPPDYYPPAGVMWASTAQQMIGTLSQAVMPPSVHKTKTGWL